MKKFESKVSPKEGYEQNGKNDSKASVFLVVS
jgi:hypothetical protein